MGNIKSIKLAQMGPNSFDISKTEYIKKNDVESLDVEEYNTLTLGQLGADVGVVAVSTIEP